MSTLPNQWDSLKRCKPLLLPNIQYESRSVRNERWLILRNTVSGEHLRLNESASAILGMLDGQTSIETLCKLNEDQGTSREQLIALLGPLCASGLLSLGSAREEEPLLRQYQQRKKNERRSRYGNPLALKFALHNPDNWLRLLTDKLPWVFNRWFLVALLCMFVGTFVVAIVNSSSIVSKFSLVASSPRHWWLYGLMYPLMKALHELAHALVIKRWGGSVHETGITFLVLMPIPYVDASDASMFPAKYQRVLVGAAGMIAECTLASIGLLVFLLVQPGLIQEIAFSVFVMGSISTLLFNANPLLKFDGYYILQDWLDIPNLYSRSLRYCRYLVRKYVFRVTDARSPVSAVGERKWFLTYGVLASIYRCFITTVIAIFLASQFLILGVALAIFALFQLLVSPVLKLVNYLRDSPELVGMRYRSIGITFGFFCLITLFIAVIPMPSSTRAEGVVWVPNQAQVFSGVEGVVDQLLVEPGENVIAGQVLMRLVAPELRTAKSVVEAELQSAEIQFRDLQQRNIVRAQGVGLEIQALNRELASLTEKEKHLDIIADSDGQFVFDEQVVVIGKHVKQGDLLAYVVNKKDLVVKAVLTQQRIERLQTGVRMLQVRLAHRFEDALDATLTRQTPAASNTLPSPALASDGRGGIAVALQADEQLKTLERVFHIELALPDGAVITGIGGKAYVTLHHQPESLGKRWWRSTRQLLLKQLTV